MKTRRLSYLLYHKLNTPGRACKNTVSGLAMCLPCTSCFQQKIASKPLDRLDDTDHSCQETALLMADKGNKAGISASDGAAAKCL